MVVFNELRITLDGKYLVINAEIPDSDYYTDIYIENIYINTLSSFDKVSATPNVDKDATVQLLDSESASKYKDIHAKSVYRVIDLDALGSSNIFFVFIETSGNYADGTPCSLSRHLDLAVAYNKYLFYKKGLEYTNSFDGCDFNRSFMDFVFRYAAFRMALETGNYTKAIEYWEQFFSDSKRTTTIRSCGCHG